MTLWRANPRHAIDIDEYRLLMAGRTRPLTQGPVSARHAERDALLSRLWPCSIVERVIDALLDGSYGTTVGPREFDPDTEQTIRYRYPLAPCGTHAAKDRHRRRNETCSACYPKVGE